MSEIYKALLKYQKEAPAVSRDAVNPHFRSKYATLEQINKQVMPLLTKHGLVLTQEPAAGDGTVCVTTRLTHADTGESITCSPSCLTDGTPQKVGSAITYLRRYGFALIGLVTDDDDDGNAAQPKDKPAPPPSGIGKVEGKSEADKEAGMRKKILDICMTVAFGNEARAPSILEEFTEYKVDGKLIRPGIRKGIELNKITGKALGAVYGKAKESLAHWEASSYTTAPAVDPDKDDIPF